MITFPTIATLCLLGLLALTTKDSEEGPKIQEYGMKRFGSGFIPSNATLTALRIQSIGILYNRTLSFADFGIAFGGNIYVTPNFRHTIAYVGDFQNVENGPQLATEYDSLGLSPAIQVLPVPIGGWWQDENTFISTAREGGNIRFNATLGDYSIKARGFMLHSVYKFEPGTRRIASELSIPDSDWHKLTNAASDPLPNFELCEFLAYPFCNLIDPIDGRNYFTVDANYTDVNDCIYWANQVDAVHSVCPYPQRSNTNLCRLIHYLLAQENPEIHCAHGRWLSEPCDDSCLPACGDLQSSVATCEDLAPYVSVYDSVVPSYRKVCKNGFYGDGSTCAPLECGHHGKCPSTENSYVCDTDNTCECNPTYIVNPNFDPNDANKGDYCVCPDSTYQVVKNDTSGQKICIMVGRCINLDNKMCPQDRKMVTCSPIQNPYSTVGNCDCNPGFDGGLDIDCTCTGDIVNSPLLGAKVCIQPGQCAKQSHCNKHQTCNIASGAYVGTCA